MPPARKVAVKRTAAKKTAAPRQNQTEKAVEAALKVYKTRVADKVEHYKDTGDLCTEEYRNIRKDLDLGDFLEGDQQIRWTVQFRGKVTQDGPCTEDAEYHADEIASALLKHLIDNGLSFECNGKPMTVKFNSEMDVWESSIEDWS